MLKSAFDALQSGRANAAEDIARRLLDQQPRNEDVLFLLALSLDAQARHAEALDVFHRLADINPAVPEYHANAGAMLRALGRDADAERSYAAAVALDPDQVEALRSLGDIALERGALPQARESYARALSVDPGDAALRALTAKAHQACGDTDAARRLLVDWRTWAANDAQALADAAAALTGDGRYDDAEAALDIALRRQPDNPRVQLLLAVLYERTNRVDAARGALDRADAAGDAALREDAAILHAVLAARDDDPANAIRRYEAILADPAAGLRHPHLRFDLARLLDRAGRCDDAMTHLTHAHALQLRQLFPDPAAVARTDTLAITRARNTREDAASWRDDDAPDAAASPIFIVGFPRSGTTLLESMLDAHPALTTMDERAFVQDLIDTMQQRGLRYPQELSRLSAADRDALRAQYRDTVRAQTSADPTRRLVDKNPLNILRLPMIARLFPHARIILALRHPCDVVLSNYMQRFQTPSYAALCRDIETLARGFADTFDFWLDQSRAFDTPVLELRHEDLVDDLPAAAAALVEFLGIAPDDRMLAFDRRSRERGYISTPSYHQVVEPLNRKGVGRWQRYRSHLEPALPHLAPYLARWNYASNS